MSNPSISLHTAAHHLVGLQLEDGWRAVSRFEPGDDHTGSYFSVGYKAVHASGIDGFLKAIDYSAALDADDPSTALADLTARFNFERDVLRLCGTSKLRRVVRALSAGKVKVPNFAVGTVNYLIFELADGDVRDVVRAADTEHQVDMLRIAHDAAVAMSQLHGVDIFHQDVKPSNLLVWRGPTRTRAKLADLGCAHATNLPSIDDQLAIAGDIAYAAPEQLYRDIAPIRSDWRRQAADVYMLGNLVCYLMTGVPFNGAREMQLSSSLHWRRWGGTFQDVLPGLVEAHVSTLEVLRHCFRDSLRSEMIELLDQLCYPDPALRGDALNRRRHQNPYRLERFVTRLDLIQRRASIKESVQ